MKKILVIATHPDDETLGCGGTIIRHAAAGDEVSVCIVCGGSSVRFPNEELIKMRREHSRKSGKILGVKDVEFFDYPIIMLDTIPQLDLVTSLEEVIFRIEPEILYIHHAEDLNSDHRIVNRACQVWCRPAKAKFLKTVLCYEIFASTERFSPNHYVRIESELEKKLEALSVFETEIQVQSRTVEMIRTLAAYRGGEVNASFAEAFWLYRSIV